MTALPARADAPPAPNPAVNDLPPPSGSRGTPGSAPIPPAPTGAAGAAEPPPDAAKAAAAKLADLVKRGSELCAGGDVDEGLASLHAAWAQQASADLAPTLASCEIKASEWPDAAEHLAYALRAVSDPEKRKPLEAAFTDVRARVGAVKVTVTVDGADVFVGDRFAGPSPLSYEVYVLPGKTRIAAKSTTYGEIEGVVDVQARGTAALKLDLAAAGAVASHHHVTEQRSMTPAYVLGAAGLIVAGAGATVFAVGATKGAAADTLLADLVKANGNSSSPCATATTGGCSTLASLRSGHDTFTEVGAGILVGGGVLLAASIIYGLRASAAPDRAAFTVVPIASQSGGGLMAHGTF